MEETYGGAWNAAGIRRILGNSVYTGKVKFAGTEYPGRHPALIHQEDFERAGQLLHTFSAQTQETSAAKSPFRAGTLLSGLLICGRCGADSGHISGGVRGAGNDHHNFRVRRHLCGDEYCISCGAFG